MSIGWWAALAAAVVNAPAALPGDPAAAFGARDAVEGISLAPDGAHVAVIQPAGRGEVLAIGDLVNGGALKGILRSTDGSERLRECRWSTDSRLVCDVEVSQNAGLSKQLVFTRMIALNSDGSGLKVVSSQGSDRSLGFAVDGGDVIDWLADGHGSVLMTRQFVPERTTGTHLASSDDGLGVERVDTAKLSHTMVEPAKSEAVEYITDGHGTVRVMGLQRHTSDGYDRSKIDYYYRKKGSRDWLPLSKLDLNGDSGFNPYAVDVDLDVVYGFDRQDGRRALFKVALDGSGKRDLVLARPDVDVDRLIRVGRQDRVVGASYATDRRISDYSDAELARLSASLGRALPNRPIVSIVDATADEAKLLIYAGSDNDPGLFYVYDKKSHHLEELLPARPELAGYKLATVQAITYPAADGTPIPAYLTLPPGSDGKNLPAIVMPHGGPASRDEWGFDWLPQFFAARGYAVLQPNYRGSTGYGEAWFQKNGFQSWQAAIGDVNDAGRYLAKSGIAAPGKLAIVGWSYGGYAALQSAVLDPDLYHAIVAVAPVTDLSMLRDESRDFTSYLLVRDFIGTGPHLRAGSPLQNVDRIKAPVLLFHGDKDVNVGVGESRAMASRLKSAGKPVTYVEFPGLDHQLDDGAARAELLGKADAFLRANLGL